MTLPAKPASAGTRTSTLPELPVVPAVRGEVFPDGFKPLDDVITLERTITVSKRIKVVGKLTTKGGNAAIKVEPWSTDRHRRIADDAVPFDDLDATVVAMNFLKSWLKTEGERLVIAEAPAVKEPPERRPDDDDDDGE